MTTIFGFTSAPIITPEDVRFTPEGVRFTPEGVRFTPEGLCFTPEGLCFTSKAFAFTPKALTNLSPGLERKRQPWVRTPKIATNPERVPRLSNPFRVDSEIELIDPRVGAQATTLGHQR